MEFRELPLGEHIGHQEGTMSRGDIQTPYLPPFLCPTVFYIWLFLSSILYRKFLTVNKVLTLWVVLVSYQSGKEGREPSGSIRIIRWKVGICEWILKWGQSTGTVPLTCGALRRHLGLVSEWVCVRESLLHIWCQEYWEQRKWFFISYTDPSYTTVKTSQRTKLRTSSKLRDLC